MAKAHQIRTARGLVARELEISLFERRIKHIEVMVFENFLGACFPSARESPAFDDSFKWTNCAEEGFAASGSSFSFDVLDDQDWLSCARPMGILTTFNVAKTHVLCFANSQTCIPHKQYVIMQLRGAAVPTGPFEFGNACTGGCV